MASKRLFIIDAFFLFPEKKKSPSQYLSQTTYDILYCNPALHVASYVSHHRHNCHVMSTVQDRYHPPIHASFHLIISNCPSKTSKLIFLCVTDFFFPFEFTCELFYLIFCLNSLLIVVYRYTCSMIIVCTIQV